MGIIGTNNLHASTSLCVIHICGPMHCYVHLVKNSGWPGCVVTLMGLVLCMEITRPIWLSVYVWIKLVYLAANCHANCKTKNTCTPLSTLVSIIIDVHCLVSNYFLGTKFL